MTHVTAFSTLTRSYAFHSIKPASPQNTTTTFQYSSTTPHIHNGARRILQSRPK